ncbi:hypothetical protein Tco_0857564 [Tanacetum coccineum]
MNLKLKGRPFAELFPWASTVVFCFLRFQNFSTGGGCGGLHMKLASGVIAFNSPFGFLGVAGLRERILDVISVIVCIGSRTNYDMSVRTAGRLTNFAQMLLREAGLEWEISAYREVEALTMSFKFRHIGRFTPEVGSARTHFSNNGFARKFSVVTNLGLAL